jgi:hypothetical protein
VISQMLIIVARPEVVVEMAVGSFIDFDGPVCSRPLPSGPAGSSGGSRRVIKDSDLLPSNFELRGASKSTTLSDLGCGEDSGSQPRAMPQVGFPESRDGAPGCGAVGPCGDFPSHKSLNPGFELLPGRLAGTCK